MKTSLVLDQEYLPVVLKLLSTAKKKIDILAFSFAIGSAWGKLNTKGAPYQIAQAIQSLKERHGSKLRVRFYTEGLRETEARNRVTGDFLADAGVEVKYGATHAKGFCIDGRHVLFGSTNLTDQSIRRNNEANLLFDDKGVASGFTRYFDHLWKGGGHGGVQLKPPMLADGAFKDVLVDMIGRAKKRLEFSIYFFNHREIESALITAAKRGVQITGFVHQHNSFALPFIWANRSTVKRLRTAGMKDLHFSIPTTFSHSKYAIMDRKEVLLGTGNWLVQDVVTHPQLYIHLVDPVVSKALARHVAEQVKNRSTND